MRVRIGGQSAWMAAANGLSAPALPFGGGAGKLVGALVLRVSRMSLHPLPVNAMGAGGLKQGLPQLGILHRLAIGRAPAVALPAENPLGDAVADIDAVGVERHLAGPLQRLQALDRSGPFHAVVGGKRRAAGEFKLPMDRKSTRLNSSH